MSRTETRPDAAPPPAPPAPEGPLGGPPGGGRGPGAPFRAFPALLLLGLLLAGAVLLWTWQRDRTQDAAVAGANRAAATAQAQQDAQATASVTARGAAATATVSAIQTAIPGVPEFTVERVELPGSPLYDELRAAEERYWVDLRGRPLRPRLVPPLGGRSGRTTGVYGRCSGSTQGPEQCS